MKAMGGNPQPLESKDPGWNTLAPRAALTTDAKKFNLNGSWRFRWSNQLIDKGSAPFFAPEHQEHIPVPASFVMPHLDNYLSQPHGKPVYTNVKYPFPIDVPFPPDINGVGEYERDVDWPFQSNSARLRFDGVEGAADIWWNGSYIGSTRGSRLPSEFDVSGLLREFNKLAVRVYTFSAASYLEDQDEWWLPGIIRDVSLIERPEVSIDDVLVRADYIDGVATLLVELKTSGQSESPVEITIIETGLSISASTKSKVPNVLPWTAETPNLYTLKVVVGQESSGEVALIRFGFRTVSIEEAVLKVNGAPIKFRGVNRHEHHPLWGRSIPEATVREELALMKKSNINAIRTSHYPPSTLLLDLADEFGFWIIDECDLETHGFGDVGWRGNPTDDEGYQEALVDRAARMVHRDKNHPSIIIWSLGNEAGVGRNLASMAKEIRSIDTSRLLHYEGDQSCEHVDIWSMMYASVDFVEKVGKFEEPIIENSELDKRRASMPFVLCEYAHAMGTGPGGLSEYQEVFDAYPRIMGGFIWEWLEHGIHSERDGRIVTHYGGDFDEVVHDGNFVIDGLVSAERKPRAQLLDLAKVFSPIRMALDDDTDQLTMISRLDHRDTTGLELRFEVQTIGGVIAGGELIYQTISPRGSLEIKLPSEIRTALLERTAVLNVWLEVTDSSWNVPIGWRVASAQAMSSKELFSKETISPESISAVVNLENAVELNSKTGQVTKIWGVAVSNWCLTLWRAPTDNDNGVAWDLSTEPSAAKRWEQMGLDRLVSRLVSIKYSDGEILVRTKVGAAATNSAVECLWKWSMEDSQLQLQLEVVPVGAWPTEWSSHWARVGVEFSIASGEETEVSWFGKGPGQSYPDTGQGSSWGWFRSSVALMQERPVRPQESSRRSDVLSAQIGSQLSVSSESGVGMTVRPWSSALVAATSHDYLLPKSDETHVVIDFACSGVGTASCGPGVLAPYRLLARKVTSELKFSKPNQKRESVDNE
jgi:beta-galactosidase